MLYINLFHLTLLFADPLEGTLHNYGYPMLPNSNVNNEATWPRLAGLNGCLGEQDILCTQHTFLSECGFALRPFLLLLKGIYRFIIRGISRVTKFLTVNWVFPAQDKTSQQYSNRRATDVQQKCRSNWMIERCIKCQTCSTFHQSDKVSCVSSSLVCLPLPHHLHHLRSSLSFSSFLASLLHLSPASSSALTSFLV